MKISSFCFLIAFLFLSFCSNAQAPDTTQSKNISSSKYLSIGSRKIGICFGNSYTYSGLRFNFFDHKCRKLNGFDLCLTHVGACSVNGLSLALVDAVNQDSVKAIRNGICIAAIAESQHKINGVGIGFFCGGNKINGMEIGGVCTANKINGSAVALIVGGDTLNGIFTGFFIFAADTVPIGKLNGIAISFINKLDAVNGLLVSIYNNSLAHKGLSIGLYNKTRNLHGIEIGLLNYAENNPKLLRYLPLINIHLKKDKSSS